MSHRTKRAKAYGPRCHVVAENTRSYMRMHPYACTAAIEHPMGVPGCVVVVAPPAALELRAMDGDR